MKNTMKALVCPLVFVAIMFFAGCGQKTATPTPANESAGPNTTTDEKGITACGGDQSCLRTNFVACHPAEFKMPFMQQTEYSISIIGQENENCHYKMNVTGQPASDCLVPMNLINDARFGHFFGQEKTPGQEQIAAEQQKMDSDYCQTK
jgi:hypothetical protein